MFQRYRFFASRFIVFTGMILLLASCHKKKEEVIVVPDASFSEYVVGYTSRVISVESTIRIRLAEDYLQPVVLNEAIDGSVISFSPSLKGDLFWRDKRTLEFVPEKPMKGGTNYTCTLNLYKLFTVPKEFEKFTFGFQTIEQNFSVVVEGYQPVSNNDLVWNKIRGTLLTADVIDGSALEKVISATQNNKKLPVTWEHASSRTKHYFTIDSVKREEVPATILIAWDGSSMGVTSKGKEEFPIPSLSDFKVLSAKVIQQPSQYIQVRFSDPLARNQNLDGLIRLTNGVSLTFTIEGNIVNVYPALRQIGSASLSIEQGIRNIMNYKLPKTEVIALAFEELKPALRLIGKGVILPSSQGLIFPFEAVNLKAVDVRIVRIFENNIAQFLQVNQLNGTNQMKRVGRLVFRREIPLTSSTPIDYGVWNAFSLDLSQLIQQEPGAIYRVELGFRKKHSTYPCVGGNDLQTEDEAAEDERMAEEEFSYWDAWEGYESGYYDDDEYYYYDEEERRNRNDPCSNAYYHEERKVARNILASDLGIIAKGGSDKWLTFAVTDLKTTGPLSGVTLEIYNYQKQLIASTTTNSDGLAKVRTDEIPFLLIARSGEQRGYLRLDEGSSLSLSTFDVSGAPVQKGLKGFIYGERGVWRPGDTLFLTFIVEDKADLIPENHPVILELVNPMGQLMKKMVRSKGINGFYHFTIPTLADAPTGNYTANIKVGGTVFSRMLKVETVKPNRLKIALDFGTKQLSISRPDIKGNMKVTWLHGAVARNLKVNVRATLNAMPTSFEKYPEYVFDDPVRRFEAEERTIFDGTLNENGEASFSSAIRVHDAAPGMLSAAFITRVFEEGGDFSIDRFSIPYAPYSTFVGIRVPKGDKARNMLLTDTLHTVQVVTVDPEGKPVSASNLEVKIYKIEWKWWWDRSGDDLADYLGSKYHQPVYLTTLSTPAGKGSFQFKIKYPEWGRFLIRVVDPNGGHATGKIVYIDWPGWAGRSTEKTPSGASMLIFSADKEKYQVGEEAVIPFPSGGVGRALVSIESGSRVIDAYWVKAEKDQTVFRFKVTEAMAPNVYVHLTLVQPHKQTTNDLPIRMYGVIPLLVENASTHLDPEITMPNVIKPEEKFSVQIKEKKGQNMTYTLAIVDEGLLDLTRFKTPDPWSSFYAREALGVRTWDLYDMVIGAYGGKLPMLLGLGGDEEGKVTGAKIRATRFKPVVLFAGPFTLEKGGKATHTFTMPRYVGSVRAMVVAGNGRAYGATEKTVPVRKPLMLAATLPRILSPGEKVDLPITIFAMEKEIRQVKIEVETNDLLVPAEGKTRMVSFSSPGDETITLPFQVASKTGWAHVRVKAMSGSETARYDIELEVRNPNTPITAYWEGIIEPGKNWETTWQGLGMAGSNSGVLEVSSLPPIDFGRRLKYLLTYPYGCVEQTTSAVFPQLYLEDVMELKQEEREAIHKNILAGIERLKLFLRPDGGFSYWPGANESDDWATSYTGHFLLEAEARGYTLPAGFKPAWIRYQKTAARDWTSVSGKYKYLAYQQSDLMQAYRLFTLALAGSAEMGAMNRLRERSDLSVEAAWRLAATYVLAGQPEAARELIKDKGIKLPAYKGFSPTYGSAERDEAMILETLVLLGDREKAFPLVKHLSSVLSGNYWLSTQTTAYSLMAISRFAGKIKSEKDLKFSYSFTQSKGVNASTEKPIIQIDIPKNLSDQGSVQISNKGAGILYARVLITGTPETGNAVTSENNLKMQVRYRTLNGQAIDVHSLKQGTDFIAEVTLTHPGVLGYYKDMALAHVFPSGWEIRNLRMEENQSAYRSDVPRYQNIKDDRVNTFFDLPKAESRTFIVLLNAAYTGKFWYPPVQCSAMYDGTVNALDGGMWVEVTK